MNRIIAATLTAMILLVLMGTYSARRITPTPVSEFCQPDCRAIVWASTSASTQCCVLGDSYY